MTDEELYEGFTPEQIERYTHEANERDHPESVAESNRRVRNMTRAEWQAVKSEGGAVTQQLSDLMDQLPGDAAVQAAIARHYAWVDKLFSSRKYLRQSMAPMRITTRVYTKQRPC